MSLFLRLYIFLMRYKNIGVDEHGNRYFEQNGKKDSASQKRYVIYKKKNDPTTIPVRWYCWLHYIDQQGIPPAQEVWIKPRQSNLTGTQSAHDPRLSISFYAKNEDYESWVP